MEIGFKLANDTQLALVRLVCGRSPQIDGVDHTDVLICRLQSVAALLPMTIIFVQIMSAFIKLYLRKKITSFSLASQSFLGRLAIIAKLRLQVYILI